MPEIGKLVRTVLSQETRGVVGDSVLRRNEFAALFQKQIIPARCAAGTSRTGARRTWIPTTSSCSCARGSLALWGSVTQM